MKTLHHQEQEVRRAIQRAFRASGLTQLQLAARTGWSQPEISYLMSDKVGSRERHFSVHRLAEVAAALGLEVRIEVGPRGKK